MKAIVHAAYWVGIAVAGAAGFLLSTQTRTYSDCILGHVRPGMGVEVAKIVEAACAGKFPTESSLLGFREPPTPGTHYLRNGSWVPPLTDDEGTGEQPRSDKQVGAQGPARNSTE